MSRLERLFQDRKQHPWSIDTHLETLRRYGSECAHITEFGTDAGFSTVAFLAARPKTLICYDIRRSEEDLALIESIAAGETATHFEFRLGDVLAIPVIEETELLFIDDLHVYAHVKAELFKHANQASKYLILHDTVVRATTDEGDELVQSTVDAPRGLQPALAEFLAANPHWQLKEHFDHQYGLTIFERVSNL